MSSHTERALDAAAQVALRSLTATPIAAAGTVAETGIALQALTAYWDVGTLADNHFEVLVVVKQALYTTNETYVFTVEVASDLAFTTPATIATIANVAQLADQLGMYVIPIHVPTLKKTNPTAAFIRVKAVAAGTAPALDYFAYMV
ncbi:MAG: hypothetical protein ABI067_15785 [Leifsonia sp.]